MKILNQQYELTPLERLKPHPRNPNLGDEGALAESIDQNGFYGAIIAQASTGHIIAGNHRYRDALVRGSKTIPVIWADMTDETALRIVTADNRITRLGREDEMLLANLLKELAETENGLLGTGFNGDDLENLLASLNTTQSNPETFTDPDDAPDLEIKSPAITQPGDIWHLGPHRLICGDATKPEDYTRLLANPEHTLETVDLVWTDPPYNVAYTGKTKAALTIENDAQSEEEFHGFLYRFYAATLEHTRPGAPIYVAHADTYGHTFRLAMLEAGWLLKQCLIWVKDQFVLGRQDHHWQHEPILYGWKPGAAHTWTGDRKQTTILEHPRPTRNTEHPTMKPVGLIERCIRNSSYPHAIVLDPFGGSGSTLIAAHRQGRVARLIELDPRYCDVIVKLWQAHTRATPTLERRTTTGLLEMRPTTLKVTA
jgi:DNA modification methylase